VAEGKDLPAGTETPAPLPALRQGLPVLEGVVPGRTRVPKESLLGPEGHRQVTGHGYRLEALTGRWKCERCSARGKERMR
jgi:hypothetical protein